MFRVLAKTVDQEALERQLEDIERLLRPQLRPEFARQLQRFRAYETPEEASGDLTRWTLARARLGLPTDPRYWPGSTNPHGEVDP